MRLTRCDNEEWKRDKEEEELRILIPHDSNCFLNFRRKARTSPGLMQSHVNVINVFIPHWSRDALSVRNFCAHWKVKWTFHLKRPLIVRVNICEHHRPKHVSRFLLLIFRHNRVNGSRRFLDRRAVTSRRRIATDNNVRVTRFAIRGKTRFFE